MGSSIQRLTSTGACTVGSRGAPRNTTPNARVMLKADTAPTNASRAPAPTKATCAPTGICWALNKPE